MESRHRLPPGIILTIIISIILAACVPIQTPPTPASATETSTPFQTPTTQWFPSTSTPTPRLVIIPSATPIYLPGVGDEILSDDFSSGGKWNTASSDEGSVSVSRNRITIAVKAPQTYLFSLRSEPLLTDFYAEISAHTALCRGGDAYGLLFRANNSASYRYALACDGTVRLERMSFARARIIQKALPSGDVPPGSPGDVRLSVWAVGSEMRFFLNGRHQFTVSDVNLPIGSIGVFAQSASGTAMTVTFSDLIVQSVAYTSPTPTMTPSKTPAPTSTMRP